MTARYTAKDPRFEATCVPCVFGRHQDCEQNISVPKPSILAGNYRCACHRCRCERRAS